MKFFAYYRISPTPRKNNPEKNQISEVKKYAFGNNIQIVDEFQDLLISGSEMSRPQFNEMQTRLSEVEGIIIFDVSRFGRNAKEAIPLFMNILNINKKIALVKNKKVLDFSKSSKMNIWELLVPIIEFFQAEEYIKNMKIRQKIGIERKNKETGTWGRKKIEINWKKYNYYREMKVPKIACAKLLNVSVKTLYRRLAERVE